MSVKGTLRRTWPVLLSYAVFSAWGLLCLVVSIFLSSSGGGGGGDVVALFGIVVATILGHVAGNVLGLARFRLAVIVVAFFVLFIGGTFLAALLGPIGAYALVAMIAALSGYLGVASRLDVVAAWFPLSLAVGAAILWINMHGETDNFYNGHKYAIWSPFTLVCLTGTVFLMLVFLATRNSLGLTAWQEVARRGGQLGQSPDEAEQVKVARPGRGSIVVLFVFTLVVLGATAALSPYLFRTAEDRDAKNGGKSHSGQHDPKDPKDPQEDNADGDPQKGQGQGKGNGKGKNGKGKGKTGKGKGKGTGKGHGHGSGHGSSGQGQSSGSSGQGQSSGSSGSSGQGQSSGSGHGSSGQGSSGQGGDQGSSGNGSGQGDDDDDDDGDDEADKSPNEPDTDHAKEAASEALRLGAKILMWFLAAAFLLMILLAVVVPPIRRKLLLRHLDRPLWPVAPTARVMNLWRRARAALADVGIEPEPGETPSAFATRATSEVQEKLGCDAPGLADAARIVEKIDYAGRGLGAEDANAMRAAVSALVAEVTPRVSFGKKFRNAWGKPPEVEG